MHVYLSFIGFLALLVLNLGLNRLNHVGIAGLKVVDRLIRAEKMLLWLHVVLESSVMLQSIILDVFPASGEQLAQLRLAHSFLSNACAFICGQLRFEESKVFLYVLFKALY